MSARSRTNLAEALQVTHDNANCRSFRSVTLKVPQTWHFLEMSDELEHFDVPNGYPELLEEIARRIARSQTRAALAVSRELVLLYWSIGAEILVRQRTEGWGAKVIDRLGRDLQSRFPGVEGFSPRNLKYMRSLAEAWPDPEIVPQRVALLPWGHLRLLLDRVKEPAARDWYLARQSGKAGTGTHSGT